MKTYFVTTNDALRLRSALGRLIEYTSFLEEESGRSYDSFLKQILEEELIEYKVEES